MTIPSRCIRRDNPHHVCNCDCDGYEARIAELDAKLETERLKSREWERLYASAHMRASIALRELEIEDSKFCEGCSRSEPKQ